MQHFNARRTINQRHKLHCAPVSCALRQDSFEQEHVQGGAPVLLLKTAAGGWWTWRLLSAVDMSLL